MAAIELQELRREFRARRGDGSATVALDDVSLEIASGSVHGFLSPNGAGKTTFVRVLSTVLLPTSGTASVLGYDVVDDTVDVRRRIGLVFGGDRGLYTRLTARQNLVYWAALYGVSSSDTSSVVAPLLALLRHTDDNLGPEGEAGNIRAGMLKRSTCPQTEQLSQIWVWDKLSEGYEK